MSGTSSSVDQRAAVLGLIPAALLKEKVEQMAQAEAWLDNKLAELRGELNVIIKDEEAIQEVGGMVSDLNIGAQTSGSKTDVVNVVGGEATAGGAKRCRDTDTQTEDDAPTSHKCHRQENEK